MSKLEAVAKIAASLAMAGYLLWIFLCRRERKVPPCEHCKHLDKKMVCFSGDRSPWHCEYGGWNNKHLQYCKRYEPRNEKEGTPDA